jgi:hypothetical protein
MYKPSSSRTTAHLLEHHPEHGRDEPVKELGDQGLEPVPKARGQGG